MDKYIVKCLRCGRKKAQETRKAYVCPSCKEKNKLKYEKKCPVCNKIYKTEHKNQIYCSYRCSNKAKIKRIKIKCKNCGKIKEIQGSDSMKSFCSKKCFNQFFLNKRNKKIELKERIDFTNKEKNKIFFLYGKKCMICYSEPDGINDKLVIHHINGKPYLNKITNLVPLCNSCHTKIHLSKDVEKYKKELFFNINKYKQNFIYKVKSLFI